MSGPKGSSYCSKAKLEEAPPHTGEICMDSEQITKISLELGATHNFHDTIPNELIRYKEEEDVVVFLIHDIMGTNQS